MAPATSKQDDGGEITASLEARAIQEASANRARTLLLSITEGVGV